MMSDVYNLECELDHPANRVDFKSSRDRVVDYFVYRKGDGKFLSFVTLLAVAQEGHTHATLAETDYVEGSGGIPLFSERFVDNVGNAIDTDVKFHKCIVECRGRNFQFLAGQTLQTRELVDVTRSSYHTLTDGSQILERAIYRTDISSDFLLARERTEPSRLLASKKLRELALSSGLKIRFLPPI